MDVSLDGCRCTVLACLLLVLSLISGLQGQPCATSGDEASALNVPVFFYPFDPSTDNIAPVNDDGSTARITTRLAFPLFNRFRQSLFVNTNGVLSFDAQISTFTPRAFPIPGMVLIAAFWADVDTRVNDGRIYYNETTDEATLCRFSAYIQSKFADFTNFRATWVFVATWHNVSFYGGSTTTPINSFQIVLGSNGRHSFALFNYGNITWTTGTASGGNGQTGLGGTPAQVGFNSGDELNFFVVPESRTSAIVNIDEIRGRTTGDMGRFLFRVDTETITEGGCNTAGSVLLGPRVGLIFGGKTVFISGPCFDENATIVCKFGDLLVDGMLVDGQRAKCVTPSFPMSGPVDFAMSTDGGQNFNFTAAFFVVENDPTHAVMRELDENWLNSPYENLQIKWNPTTFSDTDSVAIDIVSFDPIGEVDGPEVETTINIFPSTPNDGEEMMPTDGLPFTNDLGSTTPFLCTIKVSSASPNSSGEAAWSDYHPAFWFNSRLITEINDRVVAGISVSDEALRIYNITEEEASNVVLPNSGRRKKRVVPVILGVLRAIRLARLMGRIAGEIICRRWIRKEMMNRTDFRNVIPPPCTRRQAELDANFVVDDACDGSFLKRPLCFFFHRGATICFRSRNPSPNGHGQQACYDSSGTLITNPFRGGGTLDKSFAGSGSKAHFNDDVLPFLACCKATNNCAQYFLYRPTSDCEDYNPPRNGWNGGDPHFITMDGLSYTFNGRGEYSFLEYGDCKIQTRFAEINQNGRASITSALVIKKGDIPPIQIQTGTLVPLEIRINGTMQSFDDFGQNLIPLFESTVSLQLLSEAEIWLTTGSTCRVDLRVRQISGALSTQVLLNGNCANTNGLLGNFDGNADNDLVFRNGTMLPVGSSPEDIHLFGESWRLSAEESLFTYPIGLDYSDFNIPGFEPTFLDPDSLLGSSGSALCGTNLECLFDLEVTGDMNLANNTLTSTQEIMENNELFEESMAPCFSNPCGDDGGCTEDGSGVQCTCDPLYTGNRCQTVINICDPSPCENDGLCISENEGNTYLCACRSGFSGEHCQTVDNTNPCAASTCMNDGTCFYNNFEITCLCRDDYMGTRCETASSTSPCSSNPCRNRGSCIDQNNGASYRCECPSGYSGINCEIDTNPGECSPDQCRNGGICTSSNGNCACPVGYSGRNCEIVDDTNPCRLTRCENGGTCYYDTPDVICRCRDGYTGDRCQTDRGMCRSRPCLNGGLCIDGDGDSYSCACPRGYVGSVCQIVDDTNPCRSTRCENGGTCYYDTPNIICRCRDGYTGDRCQTDRGMCRSRPCQNGGLCIDGDTDTYSCACPRGYVGSVCQIVDDTNPCRSTRCENGGTCYYDTPDVICRCQDGYTGDRCQTGRGTCQSRPCKNGGLCIDGDGDTYSCACPRGYVGSVCQTAFACIPNPCKNGGLCYDRDNYPACACQDGFVGMYCQITDEEESRVVTAAVIAFAFVTVVLVTLLMLWLGHKGFFKGCRPRRQVPDKTTRIVLYGNTKYVTQHSDW